MRAAQQHRAGKCTLVTGGAGLIGSHLSELLLGEGYGVRILDNLLDTHPTEQLAGGDFCVCSPVCDLPTTPTATAEEDPTCGETVYATTK